MKHIWVFAALLPLVVTGCTAEWELPSGYILICTEDSDCPGDQTCNIEVGACVNPDQSICGNGQTEFGEDCDIGTAPTEQCEYGEERCIVCLGLDYAEREVIDPDVAQPCQFAEIRGAYCGDGLVQQGALSGGTTLIPDATEANDDGLRLLYDAGVDSGEWEACDFNPVNNQTAGIPCAQLHPWLGQGEALCKPDCRAYDTSQCNNIGMALVPEGPYLMGCNLQIDSDCIGDEHPYHQVFLDAFLIDVLEVSVADYKACVDDGVCSYNGPAEESSSNFINDRDDHPMNFVSWEEAYVYCEWRGKHLPTEAQWEKAARGNDGRRFPWGEASPTCDRAIMFGWLDEFSCANPQEEGCGLEQTWSVGSRPTGASPYGVMDMLGNVMELTSDYYGLTYYWTGLVDNSWVNPSGPSSGSHIVVRGGSWQTYSLRLLRNSARAFQEKQMRLPNVGFRCAKSAE